MTERERPHPFGIVFGDIAAERFPAIRDAVGPDPPLDVFLAASPVVELLHMLRPDEGIGEAIEDFVAFVHAAYSFWGAGARTVAIDLAGTHALCTTGPLVTVSSAPRARGVQYIQVASHVVWAQLDEESNFEPLDGWFAMPGQQVLRVVACFGVHPARPGLSAMALEGPPPEFVRRDDGSEPFAPTMAGGDAAGLHAVATPAELLLMAWRAALDGG